MPAQTKMLLGESENRSNRIAAQSSCLSLRSEGDPYLGLVDCAKRIVTEEGWMTLYRAWWVTFLGGLGSTFA
jgi:hypothetical protein